MKTALRRIPVGLWRGLRFGARGGARLLARPLFAEALVTVLAIATFITSWATYRVSHQIPDPMLPVAAALVAIPVLLLRRAPFIGWAVAIGWAVLLPLLFDRQPGWELPWSALQFIVLLALLIGVGLFARPIEVVVAVVGTAVVFGADLPNGFQPWIVGQALFVGVALLVRWLVLSRRQLAVESRTKEAEQTKRAVLEERSLIARELHDIVAHHMSMVVVQAQSAPYRLGGVDEATRAEFGSIERSARAALNEVRGVLGVLRTEGQTAADAPMPSATDVEELLRSTRASGVRLDWSLDPAALDRLGPGPGLALYRVVQESLANAVRHAPGAGIQVSVGSSGNQVLGEIRNDRAPSPIAAPPPVGTGSGIAGMTTRAEAVGGSLESGPVDGGGFVVRVRLPAAD